MSTHEAVQAGETPSFAAASVRARMRYQLIATMLSAPAIALMFLLLIGPVVAVLLLSFTDWSLGDSDFNWVDMATYQEMVEDDIFWKAIANTLIYVGIVIPGSIILGLGAALLIESVTVGRSFWRAVYFLPVMSTLIAMAVVWEFMLNAKFGMVSQVLGFFGVEAKSWLQEPDTALPALCLIAIWQALGFNMVLFMAGLTSIPRELHNAAEVDGVRSAWDRFWLVTWPLLTPVTMFVAIITAIRSFQVFDTVHVLTKGGPDNATMVLVYQIYQEGFEFFRSSYASALTVVFLGFIFLLTLFKVFVVERKVHYQ
ncbi:MAG: sugar ABC transporter permease [Hyphomicrobiaceae bacterium]|nr:sugar ABC transporter permease [Hyphomicrobiaceae bacterium]